MHKCKRPQRFAADGRILQWSTPTAGALETRLWTTDARADSPAGTVALASALVNDATLTELDNAFAREREGQLQLLVSDDFREGTQAFQQNRRPEFGDA